MERIIQAKEAELQLLEKNIINVKEELAMMQDFISPRGDEPTSRVNLDLDNPAGGEFNQSYADVLMSYSPVVKIDFKGFS